MENVAALAMPKQRSRFRRLQQRFERLGFTTYVTVANARDFGVAQNRARLFVVGIKSKLARFAAFEFPPALAGDPKTVRQVIEHLPLPVYFNRDLTPKAIPFHENHWTMVPRSVKFRPGARFDRYVRPAKGSRSFKRLEWDTQSPTIAYGHRELHIHPKGTRRVTILEAMLLQGFPHRFKFAGNLSEQVTQVSDAVPPPLAEAMARGVNRSLYRRRLQVQSALTAYHRSAGRSALPWRRTADPFHILVAEKLLQQTAARPAVVQAYASLLARWPTAGALAHAHVGDVRAILKPLGLPYRASELVSMSKALVREHGGAVPLARRELLSLPGVGEYAANAVLSFTQSEQTAIVDTNIGRFLKRLFALETAALSNPARSRSLYELASWLISGVQPSRELNYAALDLTAALCIAREPRCGGCPLSSLCVTGLSGIHDHGSLIALGESTPLPVTRKGKQAAAGSRL
jgi:endonuclease III